MSNRSSLSNKANPFSSLKILHSNQLWLLLSNYTLRPTDATTENLGISSLSSAAEALVDEVYWSDTRRPACGWRVLANIRQIHQRELIAAGPLRQGRKRESLYRLVVEYTDGSQGKIYKFNSTEDTEGYFCELTQEFPAEQLLRVVSLDALCIEQANIRLHDRILVLSGAEPAALISAIKTYSTAIA